jgi:diacylglycerol kinase (CTP)
MSQYDVPATPRVISPSPTPSDKPGSKEGYFGPVTRSVSRRQRRPSPQPISEEGSESDSGGGSDVDIDHRPRAGSRSPIIKPAGSTRRRMSGRAKKSNPVSESELLSKPLSNQHLSPNGHLSPYNKLQESWRDLSRSPSPLGLIPLHRHYRNLIHRHEIPRKLLHVSIGFLTLDLYRRGIQPSEITPWLICALVPIAAVDVVRHRSQRINQLYINCVGALMRETEVNTYNGVIWYLLGAYIVLRCFPKDVGVMGVLLLSWCDTAASTFGRLYGRYTVRLRRGKSLAGTLAAWIVGVFTVAFFWGYFAPLVGGSLEPEDALMFTGRLNLLPQGVRNLPGWIAQDTPMALNSTINGSLALGVMSVVSGIVAAGSELMTFFGLDDNLTIPVLSGIGLYGFLKIFGG